MKLQVLLFIFCLSIISCKNATKEKSNASETEASIDKEEIISEKPIISDLKIIPIAHATTVLEYKEKTIYIDPTGGAKALENQKLADLVLITDIHGDHMNIETLDALDLSKAKIVTPQAVAEKLPAKYTEQLIIMNNNETKEIDGISVRAIPMYNLREEALKFHDKGRGNGYVLMLGKDKVYFSGDTEDIIEMRDLKNIDIAFICMNLPYTMPVEKAADAVLEFKPRQVYPYHYRGTEGMSDVAKFKEIVNKGNDQIEVVQLDWYPNAD